MKFVLNRNFTLASAKGHAVDFVKDEPIHVPPALYAEARAIGAIPEGELDIDETPAAPTEVTDPEARVKAITDAMLAMVETNRREEFTATGVPHAKVVTKAVGFVVDKKECELVWADVKKTLGL